jgi:hypothetical protein
VSLSISATLLGSFFLITSKMGGASATGFLPNLVQKIKAAIPTDTTNPKPKRVFLEKTIFKVYAK